MKETIKKRLYKLKERLYLEAKYLTDYGFGIGQSIKYEIDKEKNQITVIPVDQKTKKRVAKTTQRTGKTVPVIDIKGNDVREFFAKHKKIELEIHKGKIIFTVLEEAKTQPIVNVISFEDALSKKQSLVQKHYAVNVKDFANAVGFQQLSIFDFFQASTTEVNESKKGGIVNTLKEKAIQMLSLFSGCGSLDKGFLDEEYDIVFANDRYEKKALKDYHIQTYKNNIGDHIIMKDVLEFTEEDIPQVDFVAAGIPCVKFSALNTKDNFRDSDSPVHPLVEQTINIIQWSNAKAFLIENVENFITVKKGAMLQRFKDRLKDFGIVSQVIDSSTLGSAQKRRRSFILGIKNGNPILDLPHLNEVRTVRDAFKNIENAEQQDMYFKPTPKTLERMKYVPQGGNINDVPMELRAPNKKFSNYCQRLDENKTSPTITHVQDDVFIHPHLNRYLSVRETARLFSLPDDYTFTGSLTSIFEMLKNAVDYKVSRFLAKIIKKQLLPILN